MGKSGRESTGSEDARESILRAAERCVERYGIRKTTMEDVAREAGISRPSVYRYFADRRELVLAVIVDHSARLTGKAHQFIDRQRTLEDALAEGIFYLASLGQRDEFMRYLSGADEPMATADRARISETFADITGLFWDPFLDAMEASGQLRTGLDRNDVHLWLSHVGLMVVALLESRPTWTKSEHLHFLQTFVIPAFVQPKPKSGVQSRARSK